LWTPARWLGAELAAAPRSARGAKRGMCASRKAWRAMDRGMRLFTGRDRWLDKAAEGRGVVGAPSCRRRCRRQRSKTPGLTLRACFYGCRVWIRLCLYALCRGIMRGEGCGSVALAGRPTRRRSSRQQRDRLERLGGVPQRRRRRQGQGQRLQRSERCSSRRL
jgi:hypothetical protein